MARRPEIIKYPLDLTGVNPNNLVRSEPHTLPAGTNRAIVPNYGAFYADSVIIRDANSGVILKPREQFKAVQLYQEATEKTGQEVCAVLVVTDTSITSDIEVTYQAIGGEFSYSVYALRQMLEDLDLDERPVVWGDVIGKPAAFPPAPHLHDAGDLYGFEYLVAALEQVYHGILVGDEAAHDAIRQYIDHVEQVMRALNAATRRDLTNALNDHKGDYSNSHNVTKAQVGLGSVANYSIATQAVAEQGNSNSAYMTPLRTKQAILAQVNGGLIDHRFVRKGVAENTSLQVSGGKLFAYINGVWRQVWPAQWV